MYKALVFVALVAVAQAGVAPYAAAPYAAAPVVVAAEPFDPHPQYTYSYSVNDALTGDSKGHTETRDGGVVVGRYSVADPDGTLRTVSYHSDPINGFNAVIDRQAAVIAAAPVVAAAPAYAAAAPVAYGAAGFHAAKLAAHGLAY